MGGRGHHNQTKVQNGEKNISFDVTPNYGFSRP